MSFVLAFSQAEAGGALEVYDYCFDPLASSTMNDDRRRSQSDLVLPDLEHLESVRFRLAPGSMILVDSGRYLHRLSPVEGSRKRWNACSFMALSQTGDAVYCWG